MTDRGARQFIRVLCVMNATVSIVVAIALYRMPAWLAALWPWPEVRMSFIFLSSIAASIAAVWFAVAASGELAALAGIGANTGVVGIGLIAWLIAFPDAMHGPAFTSAFSFGLAATVFGAVVYAWAKRLPVGDLRRMPAPVRIVFVAFVATLVVAGTALVLQRQVFPWRLQPGSATIFGIVFLGAAAYFAHAVANPRWAIAAPPLWGFLVYDLVLFIPYARMMMGDAGGVSVDGYYDYGDASGGINRVSLAIYLSVLGVSALLAAYCLFVSPATRVWGRASDPNAN